MKTDRQRGNQIDREDDGQTKRNRQTGGDTDRHTDKKQTDRQIGRQKRKTEE